MKEQQENNTGNIGQITFKLSSEERQTIDEMVVQSGLNLSEYCRIKCLMDEETLISQRKRIAELEKEIKISKVKLSCFKNSDVGSNDVVLKLNIEQRALLNRLYGEASKFYGFFDFKDDVKNDLNYNILYLLMITPIICLNVANKENEDEDGNIVPYHNNMLDVLKGQDYNYWRDLIEEVFSEHLRYQ